MGELQLVPVADLERQQRAGELVAFGVGPDGRVYLLFGRPPLDYRAPDGFAITQPKKTPAYHVFSFNEGAVELDLPISGERFNIHHLQPLAEDLLLVCARSHFHATNASEHNARRYSRTGEFLGEILLGDGIADVQTTGLGTIWTAYFDEGVFGNFGWESPIGAAGLVAWDQTGRRVYEYSPPVGLDQISDCYALNVAGDRDVWISYYTQFPLVHIRDGEVVGHWKLPVSGSAAFAVMPGYCLLQGGYDERDSFLLLELRRGEVAREIRRFTLVDEAGLPLSVSRARGRADSIHLLSGKSLYRFDIGSAFGVT